jgi:hypothetical protein|tara:strand:+ start:3029 stop:3400 length:372 start_codon:yes stop_codon:yes gene_type:complete
MNPLFKITYLYRFFALLFLLSIPITTALAQDPEFKQADGVEVVRKNCTSCHSAQLVTQNSGSRAVWVSRLRWMQETQGMPSLDPTDEGIILSYLAANYGQKASGRRPLLHSSLLPQNPYDLQE